MPWVGSKIIWPWERGWVQDMHKEQGRVSAEAHRREEEEVSYMRDMSRAIRHELEEHGATLQDIPDEVLVEYVTIVGAFYGDLMQEKRRRADSLLSDGKARPPDAAVTADAEGVGP